jgi:hypothetical protein
MFGLIHESNIALVDGYCLFFWDIPLRVIAPIDAIGAGMW